MELRRSDRVRRKPARYVLLGESYQVIAIDSEDDPINYKEALEDVDVQEWQKAMDREMESKHPDHGTSGLIRPLLLLVLRKALMNLVFTKESKHRR